MCALLLLPCVACAVTVSVLTFAIITTGGLHWFTSPYIHQLLFNDKTDTAKVQTLSFLGGTKWHEFPVSTVQPATGYHPLATFKVGWWCVGGCDGGRGSKQGSVGIMCINAT